MGFWKQIYLRSLARKPNITESVIENNKGSGTVVITKDPEQNLV